MSVPKNTRLTGPLQRAIVLAALLAAAPSRAADVPIVIDPTDNYPRITVTPAGPVQGDSVTVQLLLGVAGNSCMAPTYTNLSFSVAISPLEIYPPLCTLKLSYTTVPVPPGTACPMIYDPVEHGPVFKLGKLAPGSYTVMNGTTTVGSFSVRDLAVAPPDYPRIVVTPASPRAGDSVTLQVLLGVADNACMAPTFANTTFSLQVSPTAVYPPSVAVRVAYATVPPPSNKICPAVYSPTEYGPVFTLGKLQAGDYTVWDDSVRAGTFTVSERRLAVPNTSRQSRPVAPFPSATLRARANGHGAVLVSPTGRRFNLRGSLAGGQ